MSYANEMKEAIKEELERVFGFDDFGCYSHNGEWMSTESIFDVVCDVIDNYDYMFLDDED